MALPVMPLAAGFFEQVYASAWHHPVSFWGAAAITLLAFGLCARQVTSRAGKVLLALAVVFQFEIALDAWLTSPWSPLDKTTHLPLIVAIAFVILGDFRYFLLVEHRGADRLRGRALGVATAWAFVVPILWVPAFLLFPKANVRHFFLSFECMLLLVLLVMRLWWLGWRHKDARPEIKRWLVRLTYFELVQYGLWASADIVILSGWDIGYALRLVPNFLYYGVFVPFAYFSAPVGLRR